MINCKLILEIDLIPIVKSLQKQSLIKRNDLKMLVNNSDKKIIECKFVLVTNSILVTKSIPNL